jgi:hypothetical protein
MNLHGGSHMTKAVALLLGLGGVAGVCICLWTYVQLLEASTLFSKAAALMGTFLFVFGFSAWTGLQLWKRKPHAYRWAKIVLGLQVPSITAPGFAYQFYTALTLCPSYNFTDGKLHFDFEVASAIVQISHRIEVISLGLNLIALAALIYIMYASSRPIPDPKKTPMFQPQVSQ